MAPSDRALLWYQCLTLGGPVEPVPLRKNQTRNARLSSQRAGVSFVTPLCSAASSSPLAKWLLLVLLALFALVLEIVLGAGLVVAECRLLKP